MIRKLLITTILLLIPVAGWADHYYLGQWEWEDSSEQYPLGRWKAPLEDKRTGCIDLRSIPQQSLFGPSPEGYALFSYSESVSHPNLNFISKDLDAPLTAPQKAFLKNKLGIGGVSSITVREAIYELMTVLADPTGMIGWKPMRPGRDMKIRVSLGVMVKEARITPFVSKEWNTIMLSRQEDYKHILLFETPKKVAQILDYWEEQYGVPQEFFIPEGYTQLAKVKHETTLSENFDCAGSDSPDCQINWTENEGDWDIPVSADRVQCNTAAGNGCTMDTDTALSTDDHYAQAALVNYSFGAGPSAQSRVMINTSAAPLVTGNYFAIKTNTSTGVMQSNLDKVISSSTTTLSGPTSFTYSAPDTFKVQNNGGSLTADINGVNVHSASDGNLSGNVNVGLNGRRSVSSGIIEFDDFLAEDVVVAGGTRRVYFIN